MKVGVFYEGDLHIIGGRERIAIDMLKALNNLNYETHLCSLKKLDMEKISAMYQKVQIDKEYFLPQKLQKYAKGSIMKKFLLIPQIREMAKNVDVIIDSEGGLVHSFLPSSFNKKNYIVHRIGIPLETVKARNSLGNVHRLVANKILRPSKKSRIIFVDKYTKDEIEKHWNLTSDEYLYPAVQVENLSYDNTKKENIIVALGRFHPSKKTEVPIEAFAEIIKKKPNYTLHLMGGLDKRDMEYFDSINKKIRELGLEKKVFITPDAPFSKIKETLLKSKIIINAQENISIHIVVVEAMAAGVVPIVHKSGGSWYDILKEGKYGFGFSKPEDCAQTILSLLDDEKKLNTYKKLAIQRAQDFSQKAFEKNVGAIVQTIEK